MATLFSDFLTALGVRHTTGYSDMRFEQMPFKSMFGLAGLLREYGVAVAGVKVDIGTRREAFVQLPRPFLADTADGFMIVTGLDGDRVTYMSQHKEFVASVDELLGAWNGVALLAAPSPRALETEYMRHHIGELSEGVKYRFILILAIIVGGFAVWSSGLFTHWAAWLILAFDCAGIAVSWMLLEKSLGIKNARADAVCSVLGVGGCDEIARSEASSFMGIFKWSEVGMAYFTVSLAALLLFPECMPALAAINVLCLPYTVWSIWYQRFKARTWCTLCVTVQVLLWLLFVGYLCAGALGGVFPFTTAFIVDFILLGCGYLLALLGINRVDNAILRQFRLRSNGDSQNP